MTSEDSYIERIREQAAELLIEAEPGSAEGNARLQKWLSQSPKHVEEYLRMGGLWETLSDRDLAAVLQRTPTPTSRSRRSSRWLAAAAAVLLAVIGVGGWWFVTGPETHRTAVGEVTSFQLEDRSVVFMNADSELSVDYTSSERRIVLTSGEAAFDVAKDPERPFVVVSGTTRVIAVGTEFVVRRIDGHTTVTVLEGYVVVESDHDRTAVSGGETVAPETGAAIENRGVPDSGIGLGPQQRLVVDAEGLAEEPVLLAEEEPAAWRERRLVFRAERLEDVVAEFDRFNAISISIDDPALRDLRIGGVFDANDTDSLLAFLETLDGVEVHVGEDGAARVTRSR